MPRAKSAPDPDPDFDDVLDDAGDDLTSQDLSGGSSSGLSLVPMLSSDDQRQFGMWLLGLVPEPPAQVSAALNGMFAKLVWGVGLNAAAAVARATTAQDFMKVAGEVLFDAEGVQELSEDDILKRYQLAHDVQRKDLEFARKFLTQNAEHLDMASAEYSELKELLMSLPRDKAADLAARIKRGEI